MNHELISAMVAAEEALKASLGELYLCHCCGHIWRPADVPTNGVAAVQTKGKADSPIATSAPRPQDDAGAVDAETDPLETGPSVGGKNTVGAFFFRCLSDMERGDTNELELSFDFNGHHLEFELRLVSLTRTQEGGAA